MSDNVTHIFNRYTPQGERTAYKACGLDRSRDRQTRLCIHYQDGTIGVMAYAHLLEISCTSHQYLALFYSNVILTMEGRNLIALIEPLQDEKIRSLHCFHVKYFIEPAEDEPIITRILRQGLHEVGRPTA